MGETLGAELKRLRTAAGLKQPELARLTGLSQGYISQIETGARQGTESDILNRLCAALGVPFGHFAKYVSPGVVAPPAPEPPTPERFTIEIRGTVAAGLGDTPTVYRPSRTHPVGRRYPWDCYALRVTGRSCTQWGICDGDLVFVREAREAAQGDFVVAASGSEFTLKAYRDGRLWQFRPEDDEPVAVRLPEDDHVRVVGVVIGIEGDGRSFRPDAKPSARRKG